jgi:hypothetical protein
MSPRSPEEVWRLLVEEAGEDEVDRAARVTVAQAERDLAAAVFDVKAQRAKARALIEELDPRGTRPAR